MKTILTLVFLLSSHSAFSAPKTYSLRMILEEFDTANEQNPIDEIQTNEVRFNTQDGFYNESQPVLLTLSGKMYSTNAFCTYDGNVVYSTIADQAAKNLLRSSHVLADLDGKHSVYGRLEQAMGETVPRFNSSRTLVLKCEVTPVE